ncbi:carboxypeptidase [Nonlabens sp. Ci31]|uniref:M14 family metallopeptidase n=1 Tax=Nonlabens sp. Ci31 TaxID=2608253 RepID=UPI0014649F8F|nr:M14 family metallopeptidase [Nonlabens sp. Ci31]QJP34672.1 carboxypeptidase [Nonlabens sp. Ci31]
MKNILFFICIIATFQLTAQSILPPVQDWHGKNELLIVKASNPWITPAEQSDFVITPTYDETMTWLKKLADASPLIAMVSIGKSPEGRAINMVIASTDKNVSAAALKKSSKPLLLAQAGIHSGEIDGKDAGMMLLRDIAFGSKKDLIDKVNFLFIPILNVDGHERSSPYNRPNQRGPQNMGWRTNAQNLNLNRDYTKIDTDEIRAVISVINEYDPLLYMDLHVTDGADYQYDITFGGLDGLGYSKSISNWLAKTYKNQADKDLKAAGHIPGQLLFAVNNSDFSKGNVLMTGDPRFSDAYGDARHTASILVENHSLKPYKQRVLGTYILLESTLNILAKEGNSLKESTIADRNKRELKLPMKFKVPQMDANVAFENLSNATIKEQLTVAPDSLKLVGIEAKIVKSKVTNTDYVAWTGKPQTMTIVNYKASEAIDFVVRPKGYYIPVWCNEVIKRLKLHGIKMETLKEPKVVTVEMYRIQDAKFQNESGEILPFEGHMQVSGSAVPETRKETFPAGSVYISTDQTLGDLAMLLLEPKSADSFISWGFFNEIFQRTEYIEGYVMEPTITKMLKDSLELQKEFEDKKASDTVFANDPDAIYIWFYSKTKYYDERYLLYPVGRAL